MRVMTRRLLEEQMAVVVASNSGTKDDAMWHVPQLRKHFISRTFTFLLAALLILHVSAPVNAVGQLLLHTDTSSHLTQIVHSSAHFSEIPTLTFSFIL